MSNELQKIEGFSYEIAISETMDEMKNIESKLSAVAEFAKKENIALEGQNKIGRVRIELEEKKGEWLNTNFPYGGTNKYNKEEATPGVASKNMPVSPNESTRARKIKSADNKMNSL